MHRFFLAPNLLQHDQIHFPVEISHQMDRVLRLKVNTRVIVLDNLGNEFEVNLIKIDSNQCIGEIIFKKQSRSEPKTKLNLFVALTQREKFELILQKCTEIGVSSITPIISERSLVNKPVDWNKKRERWQRIIKEAAEQCGRGYIPQLSEPQSFINAIQLPATFKLIAWETENQLDLKQILRDEPVKQIALIIGPEGGFEEKEIQQAIESGWVPFSLGKRILRMETAAMIASALILYELDDMGVSQKNTLG